MDDSIWKPHTTVAALCERDGKYLLVKESINDKIVYNQPAGHLEPGESLIDAVIRETMEETQYPFTPTALQGVYRLVADGPSQKTYIRFLFRGEVGEQYGGVLDEGIISAEWMSYDQVLACREQHRSPLVVQCIDDYNSGPGYPLDILNHSFS
jgi:ADP-ribose pyrophosphatase YjhB (NUDIX family)